MASFDFGVEKSKARPEGPIPIMGSDQDPPVFFSEYGWNSQYPIEILQTLYNVADHHDIVIIIRPNGNSPLLLWDSTDAKSIATKAKSAPSRCGILEGFIPVLQSYISKYSQQEGKKAELDMERTKLEESELLSRANMFFSKITEGEELRWISKGNQIIIKYKKSELKISSSSDIELLEEEKLYTKAEVLDKVAGYFRKRLHRKMDFLYKGKQVFCLEKLGKAIFNSDGQLTLYYKDGEQRKLLSGEILDISKLAGTQEKAVQIWGYDDITVNNGTLKRGQTRAIVSDLDILVVAGSNKRVISENYITDPLIFTRYGFVNEYMQGICEALYDVGVEHSSESLYPGSQSEFEDGEYLLILPKKIRNLVRATRGHDAEETRLAASTLHDFPQTLTKENIYDTFIAITKELYYIHVNEKWAFNQKILLMIKNLNAELDKSMETGRRHSDPGTPVADAKGDEAIRFPRSLSGGIG